MKQLKNWMIVTIALMIMVQLVQAQGVLNVTFRPSANFPVKELGSTALKNGGGFEVNALYRFIPSLGVYMGWGWNTFSPSQSDNSVDHYQENGSRFGFQFIQPLSSSSKLNFHVSAGGVGHHIETENEKGDIIDDSGHGLGWEVEAGLSIPLNKRWQIVPSIRFHSLSRKITNGAVTESVDLNYVSIGVGVSWTLVTM